jgi:hypothetical protein
MSSSTKRTARCTEAGNSAKGRIVGRTGGSALIDRLARVNLWLYAAFAEDF